MAGLFLFVLIYFWFRRNRKGDTFGLIPATFLLASVGFSGWHCLGSGDYDALLVLFLTCQILFYHLYSISGSKDKNKYLLLVVFSISLAVWTKGIAGVFFAPILFIWWLVHRAWRWHSTAALIAFFGLLLFGVSSFYLIREFLEPGFFSWIIKNELGGRYIHNGEGLNTDPKLYLKLAQSRVGPLLWVFLITILPGILLAKRESRMQLLYFGSIGLFYLIIIQLSKAKVPHYDLPLYPIMAIMTGISLEQITKRLTLSKRAERLKPLAISALILLTFGLHYGRMFPEKLTDRAWNCSFEWCQTAHYLQNRLNNSESGDFILFESGYHADHWWYVQRFVDLGNEASYCGTIADLRIELAKHNRPENTDIIINQMDLMVQVQDSLGATIVGDVANLKVYRVPLSNE